MSANSSTQALNTGGQSEQVGSCAEAQREKKRLQKLKDDEKQTTIEVLVLDQALQASASKEKAKDRKGTLAFSKNKLNQSATMATAFLTPRR